MTCSSMARVGRRVQAKPAAAPTNHRRDDPGQPAPRTPRHRARRLNRRSPRDRGIELAEQLTGALRSCRGILLQTAHHEMRQRARRLHAALLDRHRTFAEVRGDQLMDRPGAERRRSRQQLVRHAPEGVDVRAMIRARIAGGLLGRHVRRRPDARPHLGEGGLRVCRGLRVRKRLRDAEVCHRRRTSGEQHVVRLDVAVHDAAGVRELERLGDVAKHADDLRDRLGSVAREVSTQRLAVHERHRVVRNAARAPGRQNRNDLRMLQLCREPDLALKPLGTELGGQLGREHFDDDLASERRLLGDEDARHPAAAQLALDPVDRAECRLQAFAKVDRGIGHGRREAGGRWIKLRSVARLSQPDRRVRDP